VHPILLASASIGCTAVPPQKVFLRTQLRHNCGCLATVRHALQDIIDGRLEKQHRGVYGPPAGKHMAAFVDDLNMPQVSRIS
jgi:hypothetical protein